MKIISIFVLFIILSSRIISAQGVEVIYPNGEENLKINDTLNVVWQLNSAAILNVKIDISYDNGLHWSNIEPSVTASDLSYAVVLAAQNFNVSSNSLIRISDAANSADFDVSDEVFTIYNLEIYQPSAGGAFESGSDIPIQWNASGDISYVSLYYSLNEGANWNFIDAVPAADGSYLWGSPVSQTSSIAVIRIADSGDLTEKFSESGIFRIGSITVNSPNGGEIFSVGDSAPITWDALAVDTADISYSTDMGGSWQGIANNLPASPANYSWTIPDLPADSILIKVSDIENAEINDVSDAPFIISRIILTSPAGNSTIQNNSVLPIKWLSSENITLVSLAYSTDGNNWLNISGSPVNASPGEFDWDLSSSSITCADTLMIKVNDFFDGGVADTSDGVISVVQLDLEYPVGGETFNIGQPVQISWSACGVNNIIIQRFDGNVRNNIDTVSASAGAYLWNADMPATTENKIRLISVEHPAIVSSSENFTTFKPALTLLSQNNGEHYKAGTELAVSFNSVGISDVLFELFDGVGWGNSTTIAAVDGDNTFRFQVPDSIDTRNALIRLQDNSDPSIADTSDNPFTISKLNLLIPDLAVNWESGSADTIRWNAGGSIDLIDILAFDDNSPMNSWSNISASSSEFEWSEAYSEYSSKLKIVIRDSQFPSVADTSLQFSRLGWVHENQIVQNGEILKAGTDLRISLSASPNFDQFKLSLLNLQDLSETIIFPLFTQTDTVWTIPAAAEVDSAALILSDFLSDGLIADTTGVFQIQRLEILEPHAGDRFESGSNQTISWYAGASIDSLKIEYSLDGNSWSPINSNNSVVAAALGQVDWTVPAAASSNCFVRIRNNDNLNIADTSGRFSIYRASIQLLSMNSGECIQAGTLQPILWNAENINSLLVSYSLDNGSNWASVNSGVPIDAAIGRFDWSVPASLSADSALIKITDFENALHSDISDESFKIGWIRINSPAANSNFRAGSIIPIDFEVSNSIKNAQVFYSDDDIPTLIPIGSAAVSPGSNIFVWDSLSNENVSSQNVRIWISDFDCRDSIVQSGGKFTVSRLKVIKPNGGEFISSNSSLEIKWNASDFIGDIRIDLLKNQTVTNIVPSVAASDSTYIWQIPLGVVSDSAKIIVTDLSDGSISDTSDNYFTIGNLSLLSFSASEKIPESQVYTINWSSGNNTNLIDIQYKLSAGGSWLYARDPDGNLLKNVNADSGIADWLVPDTPSGDCYVKITDAENPQYIAVNSIPFTIARFKLIYPNGGEFVQINPTSDNPSLVFQIRKDFVDTLRMELVDFDRNRIILQADNPAADSSAGDYFYYTMDFSNINNKDYAGNNYRLIISDLNYSNITDTSDNSFTLSYLRLVEPNGGEGQRIGMKFPVVWEASLNTIDSIDIYTREAGADNWRLINSAPLSAADDNGWIWNINIPPAENVEMKIADASHPVEVYDYSDNPFAVENITLNSPEDGETLQLNRVYTIKWTASLVAAVRVQYSLNQSQWTGIPDSLGNFIIQTNPAGDGNYELNWNPTSPLKSTDNLSLRVVDASNPDIQSVSDSIIVAELEVTYPNERTAFRIGDTYALTWKSDQISDVDIFLQRKESSVLTNIVYNVDAALGRYDNFSPREEDITNEGRIIIVSSSDPNIRDTSDNPILIGYPPIVKYDNKFQSDVIKFSLDYFAPSSRLRVEKARWKFTGENQYHPSSDELLEAGDIYTGSFSNRELNWRSAIAGLSDFEGYIDINFIFTLPDQNDAVFEVPILNVKIDNRPPPLSSESIRFADGPFVYGWNGVELTWNAARDSSKPVTYTISFIDSTNIASITTQDTSKIISELFTSSNYNIEIKASDKLGNDSIVSYSFQTRYLGDYQNEMNPSALAINSEDLLPFVNSWVSQNPDSIRAADLFPYQGNIGTTAEDFKVLVNGDGNLDTYDLLTLIDAYYVSARSRHNLPVPMKRNEFDWNETASANELEFRKGDSEIIFPVDNKNIRNARVFGADIHYNPEIFSIDSISIENSNKNADNEIMLSYIDSLNGIAHLDLMNLSGEFDGDYGIRTKIQTNYDRTQMKDSLWVSYLALNKDGEHVIDNSSKFVLTQIPAEFKLWQNYPNPFNPTTKIDFELPVKANVRLEVYNILGQRVAVLDDNIRKPGIYSYEFNSQNIRGGLASGIYIYRIIAGKYSDVKKMMLLK